VVPLQLEGRRQSVDAFIQQLHHAIVAAIDVDFANPDRLRAPECRVQLSWSHASSESLLSAAQEAASDRGSIDLDNLRQ